jgi:hypothetical protein
LDADGTTPKNRNKNKKIHLSTINKYTIKIRIYGIDAFYQSLFKNLKIPDSFLQICRENLELGEENETKIHQYYLQKLYVLLALSCNRNGSNKMIFTDFIKSIVIPQMGKDPYNEGLYLCLGEIITDNNFLVMSINLVNFIVDEIVINCTNLQDYDIQKSYLLYILSKMTSFSGYVLNRNQNLI